MASFKHMLCNTRGSDFSIDSIEAHSCVCRYNMKLMSNTAASYPMGAGRFEPWLFVNCYRVRVSILEGPTMFLKANGQWPPSLRSLDIRLQEHHHLILTLHQISWCSWHKWVAATLPSHSGLYRIMALTCVFL